MSRILPEATPPSHPGSGTAVGHGPAPLPRLGLLALVMLNVGAMIDLRGMNIEATYGLSAIFFYLFAAVGFLIPVSLVSAELTTGWPQRGGVFRWVGEAFGPRVGFLAAWLQWAQSLIWAPSAIAFGATALAFSGPHLPWDSGLAANRWFTLVIVIGVYWGVTLVSLRGIGAASALTKWGALLGTLLPAAILIGGAVTYLAQGRPSQLTFGWDHIVPDFNHPGILVLAASVLLFFSGMEVSAVHVRDVVHPRRNYPLAIVLSAAIIVGSYALGTLAIAMIIPNAQLNLTQSLFVSYADYLATFGLSWVRPLVAVAVSLGTVALIAAWVSGPSRGLLEVGRAGYLPPWFQKTNRNDVQSNILLLQAGVVSALALMFALMPVQVVYAFLTQLAVILYLGMYLLMFAAALRLRYSQPDAPRSFRVHGGLLGMWLVAGTGFAVSLGALLVSFSPPSQLRIMSPALYIGLLAVGVLAFTAAPLLIYARRKPSWQTPEGVAAFAPFRSPPPPRTE